MFATMVAYCTIIIHYVKSHSGNRKCLALPDSSTSTTYVIIELEYFMRLLLVGFRCSI